MNDALRWLTLTVLLLLWAAVEMWLDRRDRQAERRPPAGVLRFPDQLELRRRARVAGRRG